MKRFLGTTVCLLFMLPGFCQQVSGVVNDERGKRLDGTTLTVKRKSATEKQVLKDGFFSIPFSENMQLTFEFTGKQKQTISAAWPSDSLIVIMKDASYFLEPLEIRSIRVSDDAPFTKTNLNKDAVEKENLGRDIPYLLNQTPSFVATSDAGNGIGYTGMRIRGSDASRINITLNGIPFNDAESQGAFLVNMPDISSSVSSIQIQRGAGSSTNGAGAFGASVNISTNELNRNAYVQANNSYGSFNSWKHTLAAGTGIINNHFAVDVRLSRISSNGYVDRASSDLKSFYTSAVYVDDNKQVRMNIFSGKETTYQAWNGVPEHLLTTHRTFNSSGTEKPGDPYENETDNYHQTHYQLFYNQKINRILSYNIAGFLTRGLGYYEQYKADQKFSKYGLPNFQAGNQTFTKTDLIRQLWLDNYFYGGIASIQYRSSKNTIVLGGGYYQYDGGHYGKVIWANMGADKDHEYYNNPAFKTDAHAYIKWQHQLTNKLSSFADVQLRFVDYTMNGFKNTPALKVHQTYAFLNPKLGFAYTYGAYKTYLSYSLANKEPNRNDFESGTASQPKHETLHDFELGIEKNTSRFSYSVNGFYMLYKNQLIATGKINDVGAYTRENADRSYRAGVELAANASITKWLGANANVSFSKNKIDNYVEFVDDYDTGNQKSYSYRNTDIAFSPSVVGAFSVELNVIRNLSVYLIGKYVGKQYLDNTQNNGRSLKPYYVQDFRLNFKLQNRLFEETELVFFANNIFNKIYESNGYTFSYFSGGSFTTENYYFPMSGVNFMMAVNIKF